MHGYLSFSFSDVLVEKEGIHYCNVHEVVKKSLIPLLGLVNDLIITYRASGHPIGPLHPCTGCTPSLLVE